MCVNMPYAIETGHKKDYASTYNEEKKKKNNHTRTQQRNT